MPDLKALQERIDYQFQDPQLLKLAMTHPSVAYESSQPYGHNQRLEFLGDAVLGLVLTRQLYDQYPQYGEGPLTKARAHLVNRQTLADEAVKLDLGSFLILSRGEEINGGRQRPSSLADAFEALLGAVYLDGGLVAASEFVLRCFDDELSHLEVIPSLLNPKGELQEWLQARSPEPPLYHLTAVEGPDHDRLFECSVSHQGRELARGQGKSKKAAESKAASLALANLRAADKDPAD